MKYLIILLSLFILSFMYSCSKDDAGGYSDNNISPTLNDDSGNDETVTGQENQEPTVYYSILGKAQKGYCYKDGEVIVHPLDDGNFDQLPGYTGYTDENGYNVPVEISNEYSEIFYFGYCDDEVNGGNGYYKISGIVKNSDLVKNINPLTKISSIVARHLFDDSFGTTGESLEEAKSKTLNFISMPDIAESLNEMSLENDSTTDGILAAANSMILHNREDYEQGDYMIQIAKGIIENDLSLKSEILAAYGQLPILTIKANLEASFGNSSPFWRLIAPDYYTDILERDPVIQISHNLELTGSCSFDQSTFNTYAEPIVFGSGIGNSNYFVSNHPPDSQLSIWTKSADAYPVPETKLQDLTALKEIMIEPVMTYNGMFDAENMPIAGVEYYLKIRKDEDFVLSKNCSGPALPFGQVLASDDEMVTWIGPNTTSFFTRDIKYFTIN